MPLMNAVQPPNISHFSSRSLLSIGNLNEADFADIACSAIAPAIFSGIILPLYPVYCVRMYIVVSSVIGTAAGVIGGLGTSILLVRYLPSRACKTLSSIF